MKRTNKALLLSVAIHIALVSGLVLLKPWLEPGIGVSARYVEVAILDGLGPTEAGETDPATDTPPANEGGPASEQIPAPQPAQEPAPRAEPEAVGIARAPDRADPPAPPAAADQTPKATEPLAATNRPRPADISEPAARDVSPAPADAPAPTPSDGSPTRAGETPDVSPVMAAASVAALPAPVTGATAPSPVAAVAAELATQTEPIATAEAALIEERIEDWAESFAALGEWRTDTSWSDTDGEYTATVAHEPSGDDSGYDEALVTISTTRDGRTLTTQMRMQRLGFSHYAQFIDRWDPQVQIHDDVIEGRFHSNSDILIQRSGGVQPTFLGKVTTARNVNTSRSERRIRRDQVFLGGLETRVGRIAMPGRITLFDEDEPEHMLAVGRSSRLRFFGDGSYSLQPILSRRERRNDSEADDRKASAPARGELPANQPFYVVASEDAEIRVAGTVNGRVLVYSPEDIVIEDDLVLASHPLQSASSDDYLGLVSDRSIEIAAPDVTGPGDVEVHAAIYARRRFAVRGIRSRPSGELTVIGSVTAGSVTATEPRFSTRLIFDQRLTETRPPSFPVTDLYEIADWDGRWTVIEP